MKTPLCASFSQALQTAQESWSKLAITSFSSNVLASTTENLETLSSEASESVSSQPGRFLEAATEGTNQAKIAVAEASEQAISNVTNAVGNASEPVQSAVFDLETLNSASEKAKSALEQALASLQATRDRSREALSSASRNAQSVYVENGTLPGWRNRFQALFVGGRDRAFEAGQELKISRLRAILCWITSAASIWVRGRSKLVFRICWITNISLLTLKPELVGDAQSERRFLLFQFLH